MNINALMTQKSYCYLTQPDFLNAFDDETVLIAKNAHKFQFILDEDKGRFSSALISSDVVHPLTFLMVNDEKKINEIEEDASMSEEQCDDKVEKAQKLFTDEGPKNIDSILLFRRRLKPKSMKELNKDELEKIALNVLTRSNKHKDKSKFSFINENCLVNDEDYVNPDFVQINQPADTDYAENYSEEAPSIHDLYDLNVPSIVAEQYEEDMIEEYIMEEFEEGEYEIMQQ